MVKVRAVHPELARRGGLISAVALHRLANEPPLEFLDLLPERPTGRGCPRRALPRLGSSFQRLDERRRPERRARERAEGRQEAGVETVESVRIEGVGGERPDDLALRRKRAAEARVDPLRGVRVGREEAFERVGERAVGRETDRGWSPQDGVETGVPMPRVRPVEGSRNEAMGRQGEELVALKPQEAGGVEREDAPNGGEQALEAVERAE